MASLADKIQKVPPKTRMVIFFGLIALIVIGYVWQFVIPNNTKIEQLEKSVAELRSKIQQNENKIKKLDELRAEVKAYQKQLKELTEKLPPESEVSGLLRQIQGLVNQSGLILRLWRPEKRRTHSSGLYEEIPIMVNLHGGYHNTATFFDRVRKLPRIVNILNIKMANAKIGKDGAIEIEINCTAMTFSASEKKVEQPTTSTGAKVQQ